MKIGEFSKLSRVSIRMLRHYDEIGLLIPAAVDALSGYRYYRADQLRTAARITALKDMGFSLSAIGEILKIYNDREQLDRYLRVREEELQLQAAEVNHRLQLLYVARERLKEEEPMTYNVTVKTLPERYVASVRMQIPCYDQEGMVWDVLVKETADLHLVPTEPCYCSVTFHDGEYKEADVEVEAQKTVKGRYPDTEHVVFKTVPPVTYASAIYKGAYDGINEAIAAVAAWVEANGYEYAGPMFNIYHVSPAETGDSGSFVTEVCYPVRAR